MTVYTGDIDYTFAPERILQTFESAGLVVEVPQITIHEREEPNVLVGLFDSDRLAGEDLAQVDFAAIEAVTAEGRDGAR